MSEKKFNKEEIETLSKNLYSDHNEAQIETLIKVAEQSGLNPFTRQIYSTLKSSKNYKTGQYEDRQSIQATIDGLRVVAERSGKYEGQDGPYWCGNDGQWRDSWLNNKPPVAAKVGVYKKGFKTALYAVARFDAYVQKTKSGQPNHIWSKMGDTMIAKCAESLALRRAFPNELSGIYTAEEMAQADNPEPEKQPEQKSVVSETGPDGWPNPEAHVDQQMRDESYQAAQSDPDLGLEDFYFQLSGDLYKNVNGMRFTQIGADRLNNICSHLNKKQLLTKEESEMRLKLIGWLRHYQDQTTEYKFRGVK